MYKNNLTGEQISQTTYNALPYEERIKFQKMEDKSSKSDDFGVSLAIGAATNSAVLGAFIGGDIAGAIIGDLLGGNGLMD